MSGLLHPRLNGHSFLRVFSDDVRDGSRCTIKSLGSFRLREEVTTDPRRGTPSKIFDSVVPKVTGETYRQFVTNHKGRETSSD